MVEKMRYLQSYQARQAGGTDGAYHIVQVDSDGIPQPKVTILMPVARNAWALAPGTLPLCVALKVTVCKACHADQQSMSRISCSCRASCSRMM